MATRKSVGKTRPVTKRLSYKQMVAKILGDEQYAEGIRGLLCEAMQGDKDAQRELSSRFTITPGDLDALCMPQSFVDVLECGMVDPRMVRTNPTTFVMLSFARVM